MVLESTFINKASKTQTWLKIALCIGRTNSGDLDGC